MTPRSGRMTRQHGNTRVPARQDTDPAVHPGTAPGRGRHEAAVTAASVPPLSGGPGSHGSEAAHDLTIADSPGCGLCQWIASAVPPQAGPVHRQEIAAAEPVITLGPDPRMPAES